MYFCVPFILLSTTNTMWRSATLDQFRANRPGMQITFFSREIYTCRIGKGVTTKNLITSYSKPRTLLTVLYWSSFSFLPPLSYLLTPLLHTCFSPTAIIFIHLPIVSFMSDLMEPLGLCMVVLCVNIQSLQRLKGHSLD